MEQWFDLHLYITNWGTRRLMMRLPERLVSRADIGCFLREVDWVEIWTSGDNTLVDIYRDEVEPDDEWEVGSVRLAAPAQNRADVEAGELQMLSLLWLRAVANHV